MADVKKTANKVRGKLKRKFFRVSSNKNVGISLLCEMNFINFIVSELSWWQQKY